MRRLGAVVAAAVVMSAVLLPGFGSAATPDGVCAGDQGVSPGRGIGALRLGDRFADTVRKLGSPLIMETNPNSAASIGDPGWRSIARPEDGVHGRALAAFGTRTRGLQFRATNDFIGVVTVFELNECHGPSDLVIGSSWPDVLATFGRDYSTWEQARGRVNVVYNDVGLGFTVAPTVSDVGAVVAFTVFPVGRFCAEIGPKVCAQMTPPLR